jgi:hypothetical protein
LDRRLHPFPKTALRDRPQHFSTYIDQAGSGDLVTQLAELADLGTQLPLAVLEARLAHAYAPGKWSVASVLQHLIDTERVFHYRAFRIGRGDTTPLPGFDQDLFAQHDGAAAKSLADLLHEFATTRQASLAIFAAFDPTALLRGGTCSNIAISAGSLGFAIVGHQVHHVAVLKTRYGL